MSPSSDSRVPTLIFDVDDTLYDVSCGFSDHRNKEGAPTFMMEYLGLDRETALRIRNDYFKRYHSTAKALAVAQEDGLFDRPFRQQDLEDYFATRLNFKMLGKPKIQLCQDLKDCPCHLVAFSNGPRRYVKRVLETLGLFEVFGDERLFAVTDTLPYCKPEAEAFQIIFDRLGVMAEDSILVEDSMKNIVRAKELGLKTILVTGMQRGTRTDDAPDATHPAVDLAIEKVEDLRQAVPSLWGSPPAFRS